MSMTRLLPSSKVWSSRYRAFSQSFSSSVMVVLLMVLHCCCGFVPLVCCLCGCGFVLQRRFCAVGLLHLWLRFCATAPVSRRRPAAIAAAVPRRWPVAFCCRGFCRCACFRAAGLLHLLPRFHAAAPVFGSTGLPFAAPVIFYHTFFVWGQKWTRLLQKS